MLRNLRIENFRVFRKLQVPRLGHVNLIVGKNNCGKSSVLEALRIFASRGDVALLSQVISGHDEDANLAMTSEPSLDRVDDSFKHFFPDREFPAQDGVALYVGDEAGTDYVQIEHTLFVEEEFEEVSGPDKDTIRRIRRLPLSKVDLFDRKINANHGITISAGGRSQLIHLSAEMIRRRSRLPLLNEFKGIPLGYVPTKFVSSNELAAIWDRTALTEGEAFVRKALCLIDPKVEGLAFIERETNVRYAGDETYRGRTGNRVAIVKLSDQEAPVALRSMGDGMYRLLQIVLAMFASRGGFLLVDEFENGLHYSVQAAVWDLLFSLSHELDVQVFATTHSWDCIKAFCGTAVRESAIDGVLFRLGRSVMDHNRGEVIATVLDEDRLGRLTEADVDVR